MDNYSQVNELREIYKEMDVEGKKMMASTASQLFVIQKTFTNKDLPVYNESSEKSGTNRFNGVSGFLVMALLLFFAAHFFWVTLINPALLIIGITPLVILRIIITATVGMLCIGAGLVRFMLWKLPIPYLLLAIIAGILCVDPGVLTDLIGFVLIALIVTLHIIQGKREKAVAAI